MHVGDRYIIWIFLGYIIWTLFGFLTGYFSWGHGAELTGISVLLWLGYFTLEKRSFFFLFAAAYYLGASRGLLSGTAVFYNIYIGFIVYFGAALLTAATWIILWPKSKIYKIFSFLVVQILLIIPPIGLISWANPIQVAGLLFSGSGFSGLIFYPLIVAITFLIFRSWVSYIFIAGTVILASFILFFTDPISKRLDANIQSIQVMQSHFVYSSDNSSGLGEEYDRQMKFISFANSTNKDQVLLPENALGFIGHAQKSLWGGRLEREKTVFAGGLVKAKNPEQYYNALLVLDQNGMKMIYSQRVPVPIAMWKPFFDTGAIANIFGPGTVTYNDTKIGVMICYEQLIMMPYIQTFGAHPDVVYAISNLWWAKDTSIRLIEEQKLELWSRLFDTPVSFSYNE